jgi:hypothetical protein
MFNLLLSAATEYPQLLVTMQESCQIGQTPKNNDLANANTADV